LDLIIYTHCVHTQTKYESAERAKKKALITKIWLLGKIANDPVLSSLGCFWNLAGSSAFGVLGVRSILPPSPTGSLPPPTLFALMSLTGIALFSLAMLLSAVSGEAV
jgi:hypothetical protein